jgi:MFS transporter, FSR family, fosmidomycin resistance protein
LVGTTADFRGFGPRPSLPINHLHCENRRTQGRIGQVGLGVLSVPAENSLLARYTPAQWRATAFGAKFLLALGVSTIGVKLVAVIYDRAGSFAPLWLTLAGCAAFIVIAGLFLPGSLRQTGPVPAVQAAE